ncbi:2TM domain-containing protein [Bacillus wiedmannii]|uniref:2TM domain-containing protein n=1 Tax=Bacillus wiedmannii TaxID=1890302 RepID=UPI000BF13A25|nr:2TM domain-containing protein [Bacillus wiedmannii]PEO36924.1 hypothetical protein CN555_20610 [Bacillus wiedmannii]
MERDEVYLRAKKRVENLQAFYIHLTVYILVNLMLFIINISSDSSKLWFVYPLAGWGIGIVCYSNQKPTKFLRNLVGFWFF